MFFSLDFSSNVSLKFPAMTNVDRIQYSGTLPSLQSFTLCHWTKIIHMLNEATPFSYANSETANALFIMLKKDKTIRIFINNYWWLVKVLACLIFF